MPKVYSKRKNAERPPANAEYVGRPTKWGNPFIVGEHGDQETCVDLYRDWIYHRDQTQLREDARSELKNKDLVCWCAPKPCHADVLIEVANVEGTTLSAWG